MKNPQSFPVFLIIAVLALGFQGCGLFERGNIVKIERGEEGYQLLVNGEPFYIQGVGVGLASGKKGENYLAMAKELGANAVRTWGTDQGDKAYLDEAHRQGLYVDAGVWLNYVDELKTVSYLTDPEYLARKEKETLDYVRRFRKHPAVFMWNIGNEVISFTKSEEERVAFCRYLESLALKVHQLDPNHPVIYAASGTLELPYLRKYVPSLDAIGMNIYGDTLIAHIAWETLKFEAPYLITEFGALGPWDLHKDPNKKTIEQSDVAKSAHYRNSWNMLRERRNSNLGGFVFHLGETTQDALTFWNINYRGFKKEAFIVMQKIFLGKESVNHAPRIATFSGVPVSVIPGGSFQVELAASDAEGENLEYSYFASTTLEGILKYYVNSEIPVRVEGQGSKVTVYAPSEPGIYRIYGFVSDSSGNGSSASATVQVA